MKAKIFKKIKKRFSYYRNKEGKFILIDHKKREVHKVDFDFVREFYNLKELNEIEFEKTIKVSLEEFYFRTVKTIIYKAILNKTWATLIYDKTNYRHAMLKVKNKATL